MGASVLVFDRLERIIYRALTNERGAFGLENLPPDQYSVRVSLASFVPAMKRQIAVQPGMQSLLFINLATLLSSVELVYAAPGQGALMSDDWKWTLKTASDTRPILRLLPDQISVSDPNAPQPVANAIFSGTRGIVKVSGGDGASSGDETADADLGTAFALATSVFGRNRLQVAGNVAYIARTGVPATSFRTRYSSGASGAQISVTMRQAYLPRVGMAGAGAPQDGPVLRMISVASMDRISLSDRLLLEYGMSLDSVSLIDHLTSFSPFARLTYDMEGYGAVKVAFSLGTPPVELFSQASGSETESGLHQDLNNLSLAPRVSLEGGRIKLQRTESMELGYEKKFHDRTVNLTAYRDSVGNGALTIAGQEALFPSGDVLPSLTAESGTFDIGRFESSGYSAGVTQSLGDSIQLGSSAGRGGVLFADAGPVDASTGADIRSRIHGGQRYWADARITATLPRGGTQISASYQWMDYNTILPQHLYLTQNANLETGLNIHIRQPIPSFPGMPGRIEATAEVRNALAQGYLALPDSIGQRILLMQSPRIIRGGLSFIF